MNCYYCGAKLTNNRFCPSCLTDVRLWVRTACISNRLYNEGLSRAQERSLLAAAKFLELSLKYNKANIDARNLLGLIYYQVGEPISALSEWIISVNFCKENNIANDYIAAMRENPSYLEEMNQAAKKYNQALLYCQQGNYDLAQIQLKGATAQNPNMVNAYLLSALLSIRENNAKEAMTALDKVRAIDIDNPMAAKYIAICRQQIRKGGGEPMIRDEEFVEYKRENETIIQPKNVKDNTALVTVMNILLGVAIGVTITLFLLVPQVRQTSARSTNDKLAEANENLVAREKTIEELQAEIDELKASAEESSEKMSEYETQVQDSEELINMYEELIDAYVGTRDYYYSAALEKLKEIDKASLSEAGQKLYEIVYEIANTEQ